MGIFDSFKKKAKAVVDAKERIVAKAQPPKKTDLELYEDMIAEEAAFQKMLNETENAVNQYLSKVEDMTSSMNGAIQSMLRAGNEQVQRMSDSGSMFGGIGDLQKQERDYRKAKEAERRRREAEAANRAKENRRKGLNDGFTYTLRPEGTVRKLQEAFTDDYPYLRIGVYMVKTKQSADRDGSTISSYDSDTKFRDIRSFKAECEVSIDGNDTPKSLEAHFRKTSGLAIKICYNDENDERFYIGKDSKYYEMYIYDINKEFKDIGYYKADIS